MGIGINIMNTFVALTIAGSDPSGGAGIQADLKTFHQRGVYGESVITLVTVQNTQKVSAVEILSANIVAAQLEAVLEDIPPAAAKTGALGNLEIVRLMAEKAQDFKFPLVVDPVMISKHGQPLMTEQARTAFADLLLPKAFLVTPNLHEAGELARMAVCDLATMKEAAARIAAARSASCADQGRTSRRGCNRHPVLERRNFDIPVAPHFHGAHPWNGLHLFRLHHCGTGKRTESC